MLDRGMYQRWFDKLSDLVKLFYLFETEGRHGVTPVCLMLYKPLQFKPLKGLNNRGWT